MGLYLQAPPDPLGRGASHVDVAASIALGIAANRSLETGRPVHVSELLPFLASGERAA